MLAKHTVKLNDMLSEEHYFSPETWNEVITDSLNYLFILRALIDDGENEKLKGASAMPLAPNAN